MSGDQIRFGTFWHVDPGSQVLSLSQLKSLELKGYNPFNWKGMQVRGEQTPEIEVWFCSAHLEERPKPDWDDTLFLGTVLNEKRPACSRLRCSAWAVWVGIELRESNGCRQEEVGASHILKTSVIVEKEKGIEKSEYGTTTSLKVCTRISKGFHHLLRTWLPLNDSAVVYGHLILKLQSSQSSG